ncbi:oligosaccharide flippase family protein [Methylopila sp. M107]|uniref:oligosaccharide flippase family protein n=1 Tax=Methylopila sp. M107 TaxID=1101190 RepID=UPI00036B5FFC|nr:oligosaccharide flippase family protein [Methylopila sp. M107]
MGAASPARSGSKVFGWLGWAGADAIGRILLLTVSTAILSRILSPQDFGVSALVLTIVTVMAVFVGAPFEEALAQRRSLRRSHVEAALAASWAAGLVVIALSVPLGFALAAAYARPEMAGLLPVAALTILFSGHGDITTALARRRRRFNDVAFANLTAHVIGLGMAVAIAFAGAGVWALIGVRLFVSIARAVLLQVKFGPLILPRWSTQRMRELARFAGLSLIELLADNLTYLVFNNVVGAVYGLTTLGYVNMAIRLVEPVRGAVIAIAHNLAFSFFGRESRDGARLAETAATVSTRTVYLIAPMFFGLAAVTPALVPMVAGPGWDEAIHVAAFLALGAAVGLPARMIFTSLSARARPEFGLVSSLLGFSGSLVVLFVGVPFGPIAVGVSRLAGDAVQAAFAIALPDRLAGWPRLARFWSFLRPLALAAVMGLCVAVAVRWLEAAVGDLLTLAIVVPAGALLYLVLLRTFARDSFDVFLAAGAPAFLRRGANT